MNLLKSIEHDIDEAVNDIFLNYQKKLGIKYGDVDPFASFGLSEAQEKLARIIDIILNQQMPDPELCGFVWRHGEKDLSAWEVQLSEEDKDAIEVILAKYDGQGCSERNVYNESFSEIF